MYLDQDIKIAGDKPSADIMANSEKENKEEAIDAEISAKAKSLGEAVALNYIKNADGFCSGEETADYEMILQRRLLLSFAATVGFEQYTSSEVIAGLAQKSFLDTLKDTDYELYKTSSDTGAFSFYYLAFRRGSDVERRIGQTFAMLCSHDGDPIYQELGEALYCWTLSIVNKTSKELGLSS